MPHNLTITPSATMTVSVPNAADPGNIRHTLLEQGEQAIANHLAYVAPLATNAVSKTASGSQTIASSIAISGNLTVVGTSNTLAGNVGVGGDLNVADDLVVADNLTVGGGAITFTNGSVTLGTGNIHATAGGIDVGADIQTTGGDIVLPNNKHIKYASMVAQFRRVAISTGVSPQPNTGANAVAFYSGNWNITDTAYVISIPLPYYSTFTEIDALWLAYTASGATGTVELKKKSVLSWGSTPVFTTTTLASATLTTGAGNRVALATLGTPEVISNAQYEYWIEITGNASSTHTIFAAQLTVKPYSPGVI